MVKLEDEREGRWDEYGACTWILYFPECWILVRVTQSQSACDSQSRDGAHVHLVSRTEKVHGDAVRD